MNTIGVREVQSRKDLRDFIYLPERVHKNNKNWLPPIYGDEWILYDPNKNKSFGYCDYITLLAFSEGHPVGRIMGLINHRYNELKNENHARFCFLECINDAEVSHSLISSVEKWAKGKGAAKIVGPLGFSDKDPQGAQIEGFELSPVIASPTNAAYLPGLIEKEGYVKKYDLVDYIAEIPDELPEVYKRALSRFKDRPGYELIEFRSKREIKPYILEVLQVMNDAYSEIYGFVPLTDREKNELAKRYMPILDPRFIKVFSINGRVVAFVIGMPDIADGLRKARGKIFPFGFIPILRSAKRTTKLLTLLGAVLEQYRGLGIDAMMGSSILKSAASSKMVTMESHLILEHNRKSRAEFERFGGKIVKRFRIFQKDI